MSINDYPLSKDAPTVEVNNPLGVMQPGERVICEIRRHPIGLFGVYIVTGLVLAATISIAILTPIYGSFLTGQQQLGVILSAVLVAVLALIMTYISVFIYQANRWIVTSDSITQVRQTGLFDKRSSQLSLANLEDVSAQQDGIMQSLLGYGNLTVETAGERSKFILAFCPNPNEYARKIIAAHEEYIANRPEEMHEFSRPLASTQSFNQPGAPQPQQ